MTALFPVPQDPGFLPHRHFWDPGSFNLERERVFGRCWLYLGATAVLEAAGSLSADMAGLRFSVRRGKAGALEGECRDGGPDDPRVRPLEVDLCGTLVFARVAGTGGPTLAAHLAPYGERLAAMSLNAVHPADPAGVAFGANWKILAENTMDDFHGSTVHPGTIHPAVHPDWQTHLRTERHGPNSDSAWRLADGTVGWWAKLHTKLAFRRFAEEDLYRHTFIFPNFYLATFFGAVIIPHRIDPVAPDAAVLRWQLFLPATRLHSARERAFHRSTAAYLTSSALGVIKEDRPVCEAVQRGRPAILGDGVYGLRERRILDFHAAMARQLALSPEDTQP